MSVIPQWADDSQNGVHRGGDWHMVRSSRDVLERFNNTDHSLLLKDAAQPSYCVIWTVMGCLPFSHFVFCFGEIVTVAAEAGAGILLNHCISHLHQ